jgi:Holliday junction resolvase
MRYQRARRDANHKEIVAALEAVGATVVDLAAVGGGAPDLLVGFRARNFLLEIKNPQRRTRGDNAAGTLDKQAKWREAWRGQAYVVWNPLEALIAIGTNALNVKEQSAA